MSSSTQVDQENDNQENVASQSYDQYMRYRREQVKEIEKQTRSNTQQVQD